LATGSCGGAVEFQWAIAIGDKGLEGLVELLRSCVAVSVVHVHGYNDVVRWWGMDGGD
jgi:hypothetical protein